jgi:hypothetical protein
MTEAEGGHADQGAIVGFQCDSQIQFENGVRSRDCPVTSAQNLPAQTRAFEGAARDGRYDARPMWHNAEFLRARHEHLKHHQ